MNFSSTYLIHFRTCFGTETDSFIAFSSSAFSSASYISSIFALVSVDSCRLSLFNNFISRLSSIFGEANSLSFNRWSNARPFNLDTNTGSFSLVLRLQFMTFWKKVMMRKTISKGVAGEMRSTTFLTAKYGHIS